MQVNGQSAAGVVRKLEAPGPRRLGLTRQPGRPVHRARLSPQVSLREVMGQFATGVTVITAGTGANCHGMTANAFTSVSLDPPLVLCCVSRAARMHEVIMSAQSFAISILAAEQQAEAKHFADWKRPSGMAQFASVAWERGHRTGAPLLKGALAWLECELFKCYEAGDHSIFLGQVLSSTRGNAEGEIMPSESALLFFAGGFHHLLPAAA